MAFFLVGNVEIFCLQFPLTFVLQPHGTFSCGRKKNAYVVMDVHN